MKCKKCGKEVALGELYCPQCGTEIEIVPDYNVFEEDISDVISQKEWNRTQKRTEEVAEEPEMFKEKKTKIAFIVAVAAVVVLTIVLAVSLFVSNRNKLKSYKYNYEKAQEYMQMDMPEDALNAIDKALKSEPDDEDANILKAEILTYLEQKDEAIKILLATVSNHPDSIKAYELLIGYYAEDLNYKAIQELADTVENNAIYSLFMDYLVNDPKFSVEPGAYEDEVSLAITTNNEAMIYYTIDGASPKTNGILYTSEIILEEGVTTVRAYAVNEYGIESKEIEGAYEITLDLPDKPEVSLPSGTYDSAMQITIYVPSGWKAYYTWDGTTPSTASTQYTQPFEIMEGNNVLSIILVNDNGKISEVAKFNYIYFPED